MLNRAQIMGNVGKEPEIRYLEGGKKYASFSVATTERYKDSNGELRENTEWHSVVAWGRWADLVEKSIRKGQLVYVEGPLRTRSWDDPSINAKRYVTEIVATYVERLGGKSSGDKSVDPTAPEFNAQSH